MRKRSISVTAGTEPEFPSEDRQFVASLDRGLEILRAFRPDDAAGLSNRELSERTGLPASTLSRLTYTLLASGYLIYDKATGRYRMGVPVLSLGYACLAGLPFRTAAQSYMQNLADECGEGVQVALAGRAGHSVIYLACARARSVITLQMDVGSRVSLARSALGRAYFTGASPQERSEILNEMRERHTPDAFSTREQGLRAAMEDHAALGFCRSYGDVCEVVNAIAIPFQSSKQSDNGSLMAFGISGPSAHVTPDRLENDFGPRLLALTKTLGHAAP